MSRPAGVSLGQHRPVGDDVGDDGAGPGEAVEQDVTSDVSAGQEHTHALERARPFHRADHRLGSIFRQA